MSSEKYFNIEHLKLNLKRRSVRGAAITLGAEWSKLALTLVATAILARLLTPGDFGLIAMVTAITGFVGLFKDFGLSMATIQHSNITHQQVNTLFWINVGLGVLLTLVILLIAPAVAWFYGEPRLESITAALAVSFIFGGFTVQHQALLKRQMQFGTLVTVETAALAAGIVSAIAMAGFGGGYWALVVQVLVQSVVNAVGVWLASSWRPGRPARGSGVLPLIKFSNYLTASSVSFYLARNFDNILIGKYAGSDALGIYTRAYQLLLFPLEKLNHPLTTVAIPALSRLQEEPERYRIYYQKAIQSLVTVSMPIVAFLYVVADKAVLLILGPNWMEAALIFRILVPAAFVSTFNVATGWVFVSCGQVARQFRWQMFAIIVRTLGYFIGVYWWGMVGVAAAVSIATVGLRVPSIVYCFRYTPLKVKHLLSVLWRPALASWLAAGILLAQHAVLPFQGNLVMALFIDSVIYAAAYLLAWIALPNGKHILYENLDLIKHLRKAPSAV